MKNKNKTEIFLWFCRKLTLEVRLRHFDSESRTKIHFSRNLFFNKNLHPVDPSPQNSITEVTLKSVYSKGQGKGGSHNEKVDKTFDFHKSFGKLQNPDDTFQQTHVLKLNLMVEFGRFYSEKNVIIKRIIVKVFTFQT